MSGACLPIPVERQTEPQPQTLVVPLCLWRGSRTAPDTEDAKQYFRVIHPFHPWSGRQFEFVDCRRCWGQWRVFYYTEDGQLAFLPASWTDAGQVDPFVVHSRERALARFEDLLRLVDLIEDLKAKRCKGN